MTISMGYFSDQLKATMAKKNLSAYRVSTEALIGGSLLYKVLREERKPTEELIEKLSSYLPLGLSEPELTAWRILDEFGVDAVKQALQTLHQIESSQGVVSPPGEN